MAVFEIQPLQVGDIPRCVDIYFAAFQNAHSIACWPRTPKIRAWWEKMFHDELEQPGAFWLKVTHISSSTVVGFCKWVAPQEGEAPDTSLPEWPEDADADLANETFGEWARKHVEFMGIRGHWYLEMLATDPAWQGKGIGSMLIKFGTDRADTSQTECYLDASPDAVPLYEKKFGFREAGRTDTFINNSRISKTWYRNLYMIRPVQSPSS